MKAHVIENGLVINTIEVDSLDFMPNLIDGSVGGIGWTWDGKKLTAPSSEPPIPESVTMAQARKALILDGISISSVDSAIATISDPIQRQLAQTDWEYSTILRRDSLLVASLAPLLELTESKINELFIVANGL